MGKIKQLPEALANQIAAGEVVERPASVVKELVENSIDADSRTIMVELQEAGIRQIRISDDGEGMDEEDLGKAFLPHATSKIYQLSDLFQIYSLGFRGEALASIGSVAKVRLESTRRDQTVGNFIEIAGSNEVARGQAPARQGTVITVDSLFYNTPARLKHLRSLKTELGHTVRFIQEISMAYPHIRFTLLNDGQELFRSYGTGDLQQTIANVYQPSIARQLLSIKGENRDFQIAGYISPPQLTRTSKQAIHWLINGRTVKSYILTDVLVKAYGRQLMIGRYPLAVIHITLDPRLVDVNVHPTKQTVRLSKEEELTALIEASVQQILQQLNPVPRATVEELQTGISRVNEQSVETPQVGMTNRRQEQSTPYVEDEKNATFNQNHELPNISAVPKTQDHIMQQKNTDEIQQTVMMREVNNGSAHINKTLDEQEQVIIQGDGVEDEQQPTQKTHVSHSADATLVIAEEKPEYNQQLSEFPLKFTKKSTMMSLMDMDHQRPRFEQLRYVGQIHGTYLIAESEQGFYLIDQHAAQERIRYEQLMANHPSVQDQQYVLMPYVFHFSQAEMIQVEQVLPRLMELGIELELFGPNTYQLTHYPLWLDESEVERTVDDLIVRLVKEPELTVAEIKEAAIIMQSCRGAIKANHYLNAEEASHLIQALDGLEDPFHCPHGRPVFVEVTGHTLEKLFKRIQDPHERGTQR